MPISWSVEPAARRAVVTLIDPYTIQEWEAAMSAMIAARACQPWGNFLIDRRQSTPPTVEFVRRMTDFFGIHAAEMARARAAVIVSSDVGFGMARMTQLTAEARNPAITIRIFRSYDDADRWLMTNGAP